MENKPVSRLDYELTLELEVELEALEKTLLAGTAEDHSSYKYLCGRIHGIRFAMDRLIEARAKAVKDGAW